MGGPCQRGRPDWQPLPRGPRGRAGAEAGPGAQHLAAAGGWAARRPARRDGDRGAALPAPARGRLGSGGGTRVSAAAGPGPSGPNRSLAAAAAGARRHRARPVLARLHGAEPPGGRAAGALGRAAAEAPLVSLALRSVLLLLRPASGSRVSEHGAEE